MSNGVHSMPGIGVQERRPVPGQVVSVGVARLSGCGFWFLKWFVTNCNDELLWTCSLRTQTSETSFAVWTIWKLHLDTCGTLLHVPWISMPQLRLQPPTTNCEAGYVEPVLLPLGLCPRRGHLTSWNVGKECYPSMFPSYRADCAGAVGNGAPACNDNPHCGISILFRIFAPWSWEVRFTNCIIVLLPVGSSAIPTNPVGWCIQLRGHQIGSQATVLGVKPPLV